MVRLLRNLISGDVVIIVWARVYQKMLINLVSLGVRRRRVVYISHNPGSGRDRPGWRRLVEGQLLRSSNVVVHGRLLEEAVAKLGVANIFRVPHLRYPAYLSAIGVGLPDPTRASTDKGLLLLGSLRPDKLEANDLLALLEELGHRGFAGRISVAVRPYVAMPQCVARLEVENLSRDEIIPDREVGRLLTSSFVLLAPYRNVTDSGTINLALTAQLKVIAFAGGVLPEYLPPEQLVTGGLPEFVDRCLDVAVSPTDVPPEGGAAEAWTEVVRAVADAKAR
jgi:hypothetical protein